MEAASFSVSSFQPPIVNMPTDVICNRFITGQRWFIFRWSGYNRVNAIPFIPFLFQGLMNFAANTPQLAKGPEQL